MSENGSESGTDKATNAKVDETASFKKSESDDDFKLDETESVEVKPTEKAESDDISPPITPKTPTKRTKKAFKSETDEGKETSKAKAKRTKGDITTPGKEVDDAAIPSFSKKKRNSAAVDDGAAETPITPRKRRAPTKPQTAGRSISTNLEDASKEDKMLISMKDNGKTWAEIRKAWKEMTGEDTGNSTLPNRYNRLKANLATFKEEDESKLLTAKAEVEKTNELEFWGKVGVAMEAAGAEKYPIKALEKKFKELQKKPPRSPANAAEDEEMDDDE
ncbi:MAG: hypothetical protein M1835_003102 [Candelina submexicana]|nr:MAG: hypothetical protein M1835_003102 [Candelina submexicana]